MTDREKKRTRKWIVLGAAGLVTGLGALRLFRSIPVSAGTAVAVMAALIVLKHVALFLIVGSPLAAIVQSIKPKLRAVCGKPPEDA